MPQKLTPSVMGGEPGVVKRNPLNALHLVPEMLQRVGGQRQNLGPHVARRAGAGKEIDLSENTKKCKNRTKRLQWFLQRFASLKAQSHEND